MDETKVSIVENMLSNLPKIVRPEDEEDKRIVELSQMRDSVGEIFDLLLAKHGLRD